MCIFHARDERYVLIQADAGMVTSSNEGKENPRKVRSTHRHHSRPYFVSGGNTELFLDFTVNGHEKEKSKNGWTPPNRSRPQDQPTGPITTFSPSVEYRHYHPISNILSMAVVERVISRCFAMAKMSPSGWPLPNANISCFTFALFALKNFDR